MTLSPARRRRLRATPVPINRVSAALLLLGKTRAEAARELGVGYSWLSDVCNGRWPTITVANAHKLATYVGVSIEDLFPPRPAATRRPDAGTDRHGRGVGRRAAAGARRVERAVVKEEA